MNKEEQEPKFLRPVSQPRSKWKSTSSTIIEIGKVAAAFIAVIGVLSGVLGVLFVLFPQWAPWTTFRAEITDVGMMEHNVTVGEYLQRDHLQALTAQNPENQQSDLSAIVDVVGNVIRLRVDTEGFHGEPLYVRWTLYEESGSRDPELKRQDEFGWPTGTFVPENRVDIASAEVFVPLPDREGTFFVNVELWEKGDEEWTYDNGEPYLRYDEGGNLAEDKSLRCWLLERCEAAVRLSSVNSEKFKIKLLDEQPKSGRSEERAKSEET